MKFIYTLTLAAIVGIVPVFMTGNGGFGSSPAALAQSIERDCNFRWRVRNPERGGVVNNGRISVKSGGSCKTNHIGWVGGDWTYQSIQIAKQPKNGRLTKVGNFGIRLVPSPGFKGRDSADIKVNFRKVSTGEVYSTVVRTRISVK